MRPTLVKNFDTLMQIAQSIKEKNINKLDFIKIKTFCIAKDLVKMMKRQFTY